MGFAVLPASWNELTKSTKAHQVHQEQILMLFNSRSKSRFILSAPNLVRLVILGALGEFVPATRHCRAVRFIPGALLSFVVSVSACDKPARQADTTPSPAPQDTSPAKQDSLALFLRDLEPKLAPVVARLAALPAILKPDSGTARADSLFLRERADLEKSVAEVARTINTEDFQEVVYPGGAAWQKRRRGSNEPWEPDAAALSFADSVKAFAERRGVHLANAEGDVYFQSSMSAQLDAARPYVTPSMQTYLELARDEQLRPTGGDASLIIGWDELGKRVARLEQFELTYPGAVAFKLGHDLFIYNLRWYLRGADNTPAFNRDTKVLEPELRRSYNAYMANNPNTPTTILLRGYLDVLQKNGYKDSEAALQYLREKSPLPTQAVF